MASDNGSKGATAEREKVLFEASAQAQAPSKNYYQVLVTEKLVTLRWWPISFHLGPNAKPGEKKVPVEDYHDDKRTRDDIKNTFGEETEERVARLARGINDPLSQLPRDVLLQLLETMDLTSLHQLSSCNTYLHSACSCDELWEKIYLHHHGWIGDELRGVAAEITWKKVFFMSKLQLQMMLSRRRRAASAGPAGKTTPTPTGTFLTDQTY